MSYIKAPKPADQKYYDWLERLRESGAVNMWGASVHLADAFHMKKDKASAILSDWMKGHNDPARVIEKTGYQKTPLRKTVKRGA